MRPWATALASPARTRSWSCSRSSCATAASTVSTIRPVGVESLPESIDAANRCVEKAAYFYGEGAFSPFWSQIENVYSHLGDYRDAVREIEKRATRHAGLVRDSFSIGISTEQVANFPVSLDTTRAASVLYEAICNLEDMVYTAQKHPVFAQIWEQRITTKAVVAGFSNLEHIVEEIGSALASSLQEMSNQASASSHDVRASIRAVRTSIDMAALDRSREMDTLASTVSKVRHELYY